MVPGHLVDGGGQVPPVVSGQQGPPPCAPGSWHGPKEPPVHPVQFGIGGSGHSSLLHSYGKILSPVHNSKDEGHSPLTSAVQIPYASAFVAMHGPCVPPAHLHSCGSAGRKQDLSLTYEQSVFVQGSQFDPTRSR